MTTILRPTAAVMASATIDILDPFTDMDSECAICSVPIGTSHDSRCPEVRYKLPCGHWFGSDCIMKWLHISRRQDCPQCRRRMIHRGCGHLLMPHLAATAPPTVKESETPDKCVKCRGEGLVAKILKDEHDRLMAEERALRGISRLPKCFGGGGTVVTPDIEARIENLRKSFASLNQRAWEEFEEQERRQRW